MDKEHKRLELISKVVIFIPLVVVLFFLLIKSENTENASSTSSPNPTIELEQTETKASASVPAMNKNNVKLNLTGPYRCVHQNGNNIIDLSVKNKSISVDYHNETSHTNIIVSGDCGYKWEEGNATGDTMCNISQYLSIAEMLSSFNVLQFDSILSMLNQVDPSISIDPGILSSLTDTCKKQEVDDVLFEVPQTITFKDIQSVPPAE